MAFPRIVMESEEEDHFEDAFEEIPVPTSIDLPSSIEESTIGLYLFLSNKFSEAMDSLRPLYNKSMYHALIYGIIVVLRAFLTLNPQDIQMANTTMNEVLKTCEKFRKKTSMISSLSRLIYKKGISIVKEEEFHAELCYAQSLSLKASLILLQEENMFSFLKSGINFGLSYQIYRDCQELFLHLPNYQSKTQKHLAGGIKFGIGIFNLITALVPPKVLSLLNFVGYPGNLELGLTSLYEGALSSSINNILCLLTLFLYYSYISVTLGTGKEKKHNLEALLLSYLRKFPNCVFLVFCYGRLNMLKGNFDYAELKLQQCIFLQNEWQQLHHFCYWELMWCYIFQQEWRSAYHYADLLCQHSKWSKASYTFNKAIILTMLPAEFVNSVGEDITSLFLKVDSLKIKILGHSLPVENFAALKSQRYSGTTSWHTAQPVLELMYIWSGFRIIRKRQDLLSLWLVLIEKEETVLPEEQNEDYQIDDKCLVYLLKGLCLKYLGKYWRAELYFNRVITNEKMIKFDTYLVPYAYYELGLLQYQQGNKNTAIRTLKYIKNFKDFSMESRLHFRVHLALQQMTKNK
ncbi:tetratricopeptide repeat protein 39B-like [Antechinus flavipes]|uniref:tetratricopeptide repeat protein 39B-like n=1 Tax=Antechinus flavipes TaxID=38775 RepID=UPI002236BE07|nr:tetratricopeptide repeat protein 39B-like [Antechinus flavipes]XP_051831101.1 tetratricopeptide repeat protein 39B-like [Antechinus flavipes]XP_051831102.1 tetratricopeptide repeat protein 39B-like [Antechinus flavipes]XP_051831103.1 tetratricopeptide repeat protein 39B-like [Antechinus flavipes]XP_051831104.1 tetratricopeptide repeat protein 39B-like [Antechinus flavipes]